MAMPIADKSVSFWILSGTHPGRPPDIWSIILVNCRIKPTSSQTKLRYSSSSTSSTPVSNQSFNAWSLMNQKWSMILYSLSTNLNFSTILKLRWNWKRRLKKGQIMKHTNSYGTSKTSIITSYSVAWLWISLRIEGCNTTVPMTCRSRFMLILSFEILEARFEHLHPRVESIDARNETKKKSSAFKPLSSPNFLQGSKLWAFFESWAATALPKYWVLHPQGFQIICLFCLPNIF